MIKGTNFVQPGIGLLLLLSVILNIYFLVRISPETFTLSFNRERTPLELPLSQSANCTFSAESNVTYKDEKIEFSTNRSASPMTISFTNMNTNSPTMRGNAGQDDLVKLIDNDEVITAVESGPLVNGTLQSFTIFKQTGVAIWTKQYNLAGQVPFGLASMGYCD